MVTKRKNMGSVFDGIDTFEQLESRCMMSVTGSTDANVRIPVLLYHRIALDNVVDNSQEVKLSVFQSQMQWLDDNDFHTISLQTFKSWQTNPSGVALPQRPFMIIIDDGNDSDLAAADEMASHGFKGVASIRISGLGASPRSNWTDISTLSKSVASGGKGWELAAHTYYHKWLGIGSGGGTDPNNYRNSPEEIDYDVSESEQDIYDNTTPHYTVDSFVHPHDDATVRSISIAAGYVSMVFGASFSFNSGGIKAVGLTSGRQNGQLYRIGVKDGITTSNFNSELLPLVQQGEGGGATAFTPYSYSYSSSYRAHDGTVVVDGNGSANTFNLDSTYANASTPVYNGSVSPSRFHVQPSGGADTVNISSLPAYVNGGSGNDTINGGSNNDTLDGSANDDSINGGSGNDSLTGSSGNDNLNGSAGNDTIWANDGNDTLTGGSGNDQLRGGTGNDIFYANDSSSYQDTIFGDSETDTLATGESNDIINSIEVDLR